jgi:hypothetical protein
VMGISGVAPAQHGKAPGGSRFAPTVLHISKSKRRPAALGSGMAARRRCTATRWCGAKAVLGDESPLQYCRGTTLTDMWDRTHM